MEKEKTKGLNVVEIAIFFFYIFCLENSSLLLLLFARASFIYKNFKMSRVKRLFLIFYICTGLYIQFHICYIVYCTKGFLNQFLLNALTKLTQFINF